MMEFAASAPAAPSAAINAANSRLQRNSDRRCRPRPILAVDFINDVEVARFAVVGHRHFSDVHAAEFFHRLARAQIAGADVKYDAIGEPEGVLQHQGFQGAVGAAAPMAAGEEGVADGDAARRLLPVVVARTTDQRAARSVADAHGSARLDGALEVGGKGLALIAILVRML